MVCISKETPNIRDGVYFKGNAKYKGWCVFQRELQILGMVHNSEGTPNIRDGVYFRGNSKY